MTKPLENPLVPGSPQWWLARPARSQKASGRGRPSLSFDKIIATALEAVDEVGSGAFNMRMLAERLGSGTATLYRHVTSKDEILVYVVDQVLGELDTDAEEAAPMAWQRACLSGAERLYRLLRKHPAVVPLLVAQVPVGPNGLRTRERGIAMFLTNGFAPDLAARAYTTVVHYVLGFAMQQHASCTDAAAEGQGLVSFFAQLDPDDYPSIARAGQYLPGLSIDDEFRFGLKLIINGLDQAFAEGQG